jgi:hypothetical protein
MNKSAFVMLAAVVVAGSSAGVAVSPVAFITTIVVAAIILRAASRATGVVVHSAGEFPELPADLRERVQTTFATLPEGQARQLLLAVVVRARPIFATPSTTFDPDHENATRADVASLLDVCAVTARELSLLDESGVAGDARGKQARELLVRRLGDAADAINALYLAGIERGTPASQRVAELAAEIKQEAGAREYANDRL